MPPLLSISALQSPQKLCSGCNQGPWLMVMKIIKVCACHQHTVCGINQRMIGDEGNCHCRGLWCVGWSMHCTVGGRERLQHLQTDKTATA